jgi:protein-S-isoprenylcysteine O-methyltransferase Ste14
MSEEKIITELIKMKNKSARHRELKSYLLAQGFSEEKAEEYIIKASQINTQKNKDSLPLENKIKFGVATGLVLLTLVLMFFVFPYQTFVHVRIFSIFGTLFLTIGLFYVLKYYKSWEKEKIEQKSNDVNSSTNEAPIGLLFIPMLLFYFIFSWVLENGQEKILKQTQVEAIGTIVGGSSLSSRSFDMTELIIEYSTKEGKKIRATKEISKSEFNKYGKGQTVKLLYSTRDTQNIELLTSEENIKKFKDSEERNFTLNDIFNLLDTPNAKILENLNKVKYGWVYKDDVWVNDSYQSLIMKEGSSVSFITAQNFIYTFPNKIKKLGYKEISKPSTKNPLIVLNRQFENDVYIIYFKKEYVSEKHLVNMTIIKK